MPNRSAQCILHSMERSRPWWKSILLNVRALACGVIVAVGSVTAYEWVGASVNGGVLTPDEHARVAAILATSIALQLLVVCVPIWLLLHKLHLTGWISAALLGFIGPLAYWMAVNDNPAHELLRDGFAYGLCGGLAGLAIWWTRPTAAPHLVPAAQ